MPTKLTRRQFLLRTAAGLGATVLACGGATTLVLITPPLAYTETQSPSGDQTMNKKILVAYATRCGSTIEVAAAIAGELNQNGLSADVRAMKHVTDLQGYNAVVLGSAIRMGNWIPEALKFVETHQAELNNLPVAIFSVHMINLGGDEASKTARTTYHDAVHCLIKPAAEAWFAGVIDMNKMSFIDRLMTKAMKATNEDKRDWKAIQG
jgi:menaquinone-dependent protoporphyrinogen oxidase